MDNPGHSGNSNLPRRFDRPNSSDDVVDSDFVNEKGKITSDRSYHYQISSHDGSDRHELPSSRQNMSSNDRSCEHGILPGHNKKKNAFCNRPLWVGIIVGSLLSALIVGTAVYFLTKSSFGTDNTLKTDSYLPLKFDWYTLYHSLFLSEDGLKISNHYSKDTPVSAVDNPSTLSEYNGVIGNICFAKNSKIYYEVQFEFHVINNHSPKNLIFEIGLAERAKVDNHHYIGTTRTNGWSYIFNICDEQDDKTCLNAQHNNKYAFDPTPWHNITLGSKHTGLFGVIVNRNKEKFSIVQNFSAGESIIRQFENVYSSQELCPVFGVFNAGSFEVKLTLSNTYDFSDDMWNTVFIS